ncbi:hypothetical protein FRC06_002702 [Ceratobasidium sp. 370]|nr:hypothetical protein FRC06_002702 [Ceratobasidium sp. 370]
MSAGPTQADVLVAQALAKLARAIQATTSLAVASLAVMVFDTIITCDQEAKFVWRQQWSFGKAMFLFIRHFPTLLMAGHVTSMLLYDPSLELYVVLSGTLWY